MQTIELAVEAWSLIAKQSLEEFELLIHARPASVERHAEQLRFFAHPADAAAEDETTIRQHVECRELLGRRNRMTIRQDQHGEAELEPFRTSSDESLGRDHVQPR